jgi:hypothetical protein
MTCIRFGNTGHWDAQLAHFRCPVKWFPIASVSPEHQGLLFVKCDESQVHLLYVKLLKTNGKIQGLFGGIFVLLSMVRHAVLPRVWAKMFNAIRSPWLKKVRWLIWP